MLDPDLSYLNSIPICTVSVLVRHDKRVKALFIIIIIIIIFFL